MIYTSSVLTDEMEKPFIGESRHKWKIFVVSLLIVILTFVISSAFSTLSDTFVGEQFSIFTHSNAFSIISILNIVVAFYLVIYLYRNYQRVTLNDLYDNKMYLLIKLGQKTNKIVYFRLISVILYSLALYILTVIFSVIGCLIFGYQLSLGSQFSLIIEGLIFSLAASMSTLTISTFIKQRKYGFLISLGGIIIFFIYAFLGGFYKVVSSQTQMMSFSNMFKIVPTSGLMLSLGILILVCIIECLVSCKLRSLNYYTDRSALKDLVVIDYSSDKVIQPKKDYSSLFKKIARVFKYTLFILICLSALATNFYLISIGSKTLDGDYSVGTKVSTLFASDTLKPDLYENDFVTFITIDETYPVKQGDIVYYTKESTLTSTSYTAVVEVISINGDEYNVNILNETADLDMADTITLSQIKGVKIYSSRGLGAWIVFNQSIIGKVIMLGVPIIVILFYDNIEKFALAYKKVSQEEEQKDE